MILIRGSQSNRFLYGDYDGTTRIPNGAWDIVSAKFVDATKGEVVTLTGGADPGRVFAQTEVAHLLANKKITSVDGIPHQQLSALSAQQAFEAIKAQSEVRSSQLKIVVDAQGQPIDFNGSYRLDTTAFFADTDAVTGKAVDGDLITRSMADLVPQDRLLTHSEGIKELQTIHENLSQNLPEEPGKQPKHAHLDDVSRLFRSLDLIGTAIDILSLGAAALEAKAALDAGDRERAQTILVDWALENASAIVAGRLAAIATAPLLAAGPLGALLAAGLTISASAAGATYGDDLLRQLFAQLTAWTDGFIDDLKDTFYMAEITVSPLILDLDGDGISTLSVSSSEAYFDHDGNGFAERTGWVAPGDALLVRDLDGNGRIETGAELFGNQTLLASGKPAWNGFEALRQLDSNFDSRITPLDSVWSELRLWKDANSNASVEAGELLELQVAGVSALNLAYTYGFNADEAGNMHRQLGTYLASDGTSHLMHDVWFEVDLARTRQSAPLPVSVEISRLPDLPGFGNVPSLHQAMALDASGQLMESLQQWLAAAPQERAGRMEAFILQWTGVQNLEDPNAPDDPLPRRRLAALERFLGRDFRSGWAVTEPGHRAYVLIEEAFDQLSLELENQLLAQTEVLPLLRASSSGRDLEALLHNVNVDHLTADLRDLFSVNPDVETITRLGDILDRLAADDPSLRQALLERSGTEAGLFGVQLLAMTSIDSVVLGGDIDEALIGSAAAEWIDGLAGNDTLYGYAGADILIGGPGDDMLVGAYGSDVYVVSSGAGKDVLTEYDPTPGNVDEVRFLDVASTEVQTLQRAGSDLVIGYGIADQITVKNHFLGDPYRIEQFRFLDGVVWAEAELSEQMLAASQIL